MTHALEGCAAIQGSAGYNMLGRFARMVESDNARSLSDAAQVLGARCALAARGLLDALLQQHLQPDGSTLDDGKCLLLKACSQQPACCALPGTQQALTCSMMLMSEASARAWENASTIEPCGVGASSKC